MWKFILFIVIAIIAVWQLGVFSQKDTDKVATNSNNTTQKEITAKKSDKIEDVAISSIEGSLKLQMNDDDSRVEERKDIKKVETKIEDSKTVTTTVTEKEPKRVDLKKEVEKDKVESNKVDIATKDKVETKKVEVAKAEPIKKEEPKDETTIKVSSIKGAFKDLTKEPKKETADESVKTDATKKINNLVKKSEYEKMLLAEVDDSQAPKEDTTNSSLPVASNSVIRDRLQKLLTSAKKAIDKESDSIVAKADDVDTSNSVAISNKSSKDLLNELVKNASNSKSKSESTYVANLLSEVSKSKITVVEVKEDYTTIIVKAGDSLSTIAKNIYGDQNKYYLIYEANKDKLKNPNVISIGTVLKIPKN